MNKQKSKTRIEYREGIVQNRSQLWLWWANLPRISSFCQKLCAFMFETHFITICNADIKLPLHTCIRIEWILTFIFFYSCIFPLCSYLLFQLSCVGDLVKSVFFFSIIFSFVRLFRWKFLFWFIKNVHSFDANMSLNAFCFDSMPNWNNCQRDDDMTNGQANAWIDEIFL